jgi:hypothetical protein
MAADNEHGGEQGIKSLPHFWSTAVQLVGTFGLAVFLVLYYVLVMHPQERSRYDELKQAVESLIRVVEKEQTLLTNEQARQLESLYVLAVAGELAPVIHEELAKGTAVDALADSIAAVLQQRTELLQRLVRMDGRPVSEPIVYRLAQGPPIGQEIAEIAETGWRESSVQEISKQLEAKLERSSALARLEK